MDFNKTDFIKQRDIVNIKHITDGWSNDEKFFMEDSKGCRFLLRLTEKKHLDEKLKDIRIIKKINELHFNMSRLIEGGYSEELDKAYMLFTWIDGVGLKEYIVGLNETEQFRMGLQSGQILKMIHDIPVNENDISSKNQVTKKQKQLEEYLSCNHRIHNDKCAVDYICQNLDLLNCVKSVYKHGDFHLGNLLFSDENGLGVIDFDRVGCGDGYSEFYKLQAFEVEISIPYSIGKIKGYFNGEPSENFWRLLKLYVAHSSLYSIKWAEEFGDDEINGMLRRYNDAAVDYDNFQRIIPKWYSDNKDNY